jgi:DNA invertase Pin-like site-specific DNA recombinase
MKIGYLRVSTKDQNLELQKDALLGYGCERLFEEKVSALSKVRPELDRLLDNLRPGDEVVVWRLDRLGRSLKDLIRIVDEFKKLDVSFVSINDKMDTSSPHGRLVFNFFASIAEYERELIRERTIAGIEAARKQGRIGGKRKGLTNSAKLKAAEAKKMYEDTDPRTKLSIDGICTELKITKRTFYRYLDYLDVARAKRPLVKKGLENETIPE